MAELRKATVFDHVRFVLSSLILLFSLVVTSYAIVTQKTLFWDTVPGWVALLLFIVDLFVLGLVEGLQIALVELKRQHPDSYKKSHPRAYYLGQIAACGDNVERFLMGRQVFVVFLVFFAAKLTTIHLEEGEEFLFPVPGWVESTFFETGFLACIVVVIIAQLMAQIAAAKYPVHFLEFLIMRPTYYACIILELTGLTHACWLLTGLLQCAFGMHDDNTTSNPNEYRTPEDIILMVEDTLDEVKVKTNDDDDEIDNKDDGISSGSSDSCSDTASGTLTQSAYTKQFSCYTKLVDQLNSSITPDTLHVVRNYLDRHPEKFNQFPSVVGNKLYPAPGAMSSQLQKNGHEVPPFLLDISDPDHVPPHIVACELVARNRELQAELDMAYKKLAD